jgi:hypothetical protein
MSGPIGGIGMPEPVVTELAVLNFGTHNDFNAEFSIVTLAHATQQCSLGIS